MKSVKIATCMLGLIAGLCIAAVPAYAVEEDARVLILNGMDPYLPAFLAIDSAMRANLADETPRRIIFFAEPLDAQRFPVQVLEPEYLALLTKKYSTLRVDVVVAVTQAALEFFERHGERLWPGARLVYVGFPGEVIRPAELPANTTGVVTHLDIEGTIDLARRLQPDARRILVVSGVSDLDRRAEQLARQALSMKAGNATAEYLSGLPLPELTARVASEPANSIVLYLAQFRDRDGRPYTPREVLRSISAKSVAPVYSVAETYVRFGMVAGSMESYAYKEAEHRRAGTCGAGGRAGRSESRPARSAEPMYCGRAVLERWSLDERRLPQGCEIRFADHSYLREHLWQILAGLAVIVGQSFLIAALLVQRRRRRRAESESLQRLSEMAHMNRRVAMGEICAI